MDAVAFEPGSLVEAVTGAAGKLRLRAHLEDAALRRSSTMWQLELSRLVERDQPEPANAHRHLQVESAAARCRRHDDESRLCAADLGTQGAAIETLEPGASPPPACQCKQTRDRPNSTPGARSKPDCCGTDERSERGQADEIRERDPKAHGRQQRVRWGTDWSRDHGATRSFSWSSLAGPIPGTASSSSTDVNAPCCWR